MQEGNNDVIEIEVGKEKSLDDLTGAVKSLSNAFTKMNKAIQDFASAFTRFVEVYKKEQN